jgi:hypothetical protein
MSQNQEHGLSSTIAAQQGRTLVILANAWQVDVLLHTDTF